MVGPTTYGTNDSPEEFCDNEVVTFVPEPNPCSVASTDDGS